ncbi:MAG: hypothetical protein NXI22_11645 [bacterium]|nr:hypothetical protein [bacterium]
MQCQLCGRTTKRGTTEHHLIPRTCHRNKWFKKNFTREEMQTTVPLCRDCHRAVHDFVPSEKLLGREFNTLAKLREHPQIGPFLKWLRRQR